jgi:hypothetical protein
LIFLFAKRMEELLSLLIVLGIGNCLHDRY